jgi:hypothetical protein
MNDKIRNNIWKRDKGICQNCQKQLYKEIDPYEELIEELLSLTNIPIYRWSKECWKCHKQTDIVTYGFALEYNYHIGDLEKIDNELMKQFPFVKKVFSKTMETKIVANTCIYCGALQGNWFVMEDIIQMRSSDFDMNKLKEKEIPNPLKFEDLLIEKEELNPYQEKLPLIAHVHHIDTNRENNDMQNLILLCRECHVMVHSKIRNSLT